MTGPDIEALLRAGWKVTPGRQGNWLIAVRRGKLWLRAITAPDAETLLACLATADWDRDNH